VDGTDNNTNGLSWASAFASLGGALSGFTNSCPTQTTPPKTCVIHVGAGLGITLSSTFTLNRSYTTIECEPGAVIQTESSGNPIIITANNTRITGCTFIWTQNPNPDISSSENAIDIKSPASGIQVVTIDHNIFKNYPGTASGGTGAGTVIFVGDRTNNNTSGVFVSNVSVTDNRFLNNTGNHISILDNAQQINVSRNIVYTGQGLAMTKDQILNAQTEDAGTTIQGLNIVGNVMFNGIPGNCIQVQQIQLTSSGTLAGGRISDVTVSSNVCILSSLSLAGNVGTGYSMAGVTGLSSVGNVFDANGQTINVNSNAPFEFINVQNSTISGNSAILGNQTITTAGSSPLHIFTMGGASETSMTHPTLFVAGQLSGNTFTGNSASVAFSSGTTTGIFAICFAGGFGATGNGANTQIVSNNIFMGNSCDFTGSAATAATVGFYLQGNSSTTIANNFVTENNFIAPSGTNAADGISLQPGGGAMTNNVVGFNNLTNFNIKYCHNLGSCSSSKNLLSSTVTCLGYGSVLNGPNGNPNTCSTN
jgi:hypothetical protein